MSLGRQVFVFLNHKMFVSVIASDECRLLRDRRQLLVSSNYGMLVGLEDEIKNH